MTNAEATDLLDQVEALVSEHCLEAVIIGTVEDENGNRFTIRRKLGSDAAAIGMMEMLKYDLIRAPMIGAE